MERKFQKGKSGVKGEFVLTKIDSETNTPDRAQVKQKRKMMKTFLDDRYIAENYYKGFEGEQSLLFEKDGTISKLK